MNHPTTPPPPPGQGGPTAPQGGPHGGPYGAPQGAQYGTSWQDHPQPAQQQWGPGHPPAPPVPPTPPAKRSWFRRHKITTGLLVLIGVGVVGSALSGDPEEPAEAETVAAAETDTTGNAEPAAPVESVAAETVAADTEDVGSDEAAPEEAAAEEAAAEEPEAPAEDTSPGLNTAVQDGKFEFVVTAVETGLESIGEGFTEEQAQGQFVLVHLSVTNIGDQGQTLFDSNQVLLDEQGRQHNTSSASIWLDDGLWLDDINPGNSTEGVLLYDIPLDSVPAALELHDSMFSGGVTVALQ